MVSLEDWKMSCRVIKSRVFDHDLRNRGTQVFRFSVKCEVGSFDGTGVVSRWL